MSIRKTIFVIIILYSLLLLLGCDNPNTIKNVHVNELIEEIEKKENIKKITSYNRGFDLIINIYVEDSFQFEDDGLTILGSAKTCLNSNVINELKTEFNQEFLPDTVIYLRNKDGKILIDFVGSCYDSYGRMEVPAYDEYVWVTSTCDSSSETQGDD